MKLYQNGLLINDGTSPLTNSTVYNLAGTYNITVLYPETEDYASSLETHFITVQDITPPTITVLSPVNNTSYSKVNISFNFTNSTPTSWIGYSLNNTPNVTIAGPINLTGLADGWNNITVFANDTSGNMGASDTVYFFYCIGDITKDKKVDGKDIAIVAKYYGTKCGDGKYYAPADLNDDCKIDGKDIAIVSKYYGKIC
jgi:hypothetical protein